MKFSRVSSVFAICALVLVGTLPSDTVAQAVTTPDTTTTKPTTTTTTTPRPPVTTPLTTVSTTRSITTTQPVRTTTATPPPPGTSAPPATSTSPAGNTTCVSTADCPSNYLCSLASATALTGTCQQMTQGQLLCISSIPVACVTHSDCNTPEYSYCIPQKGGDKCAGLGRPGTSTDCKNGTITPPAKEDDNTVTNALMYAGIAVGAILVLGIMFALVRWRRNKNKSKMPEFSAIDYGMSNRHRSEPRRSSVGAAAAATSSGGQSYPFSSRPTGGQSKNAGAQDAFYDDQYYNDQYDNTQYNQHGGGYGQQGYDQNGYDQYGYDQNGYDQQGYNQQGYNQQGYNQGYDQGYDQQYYKEGGYNNAGYDQQGNYVGEGYYDQNQAAGYDDKAYAQNNAVSQPAAPAEALVRAGSRQRLNAADDYGVEPSELDFGGNNNNQRPGYGKF
ncbi:hypothetical protein BGZ76_000173 [Entomortierella beljakovae]|nr:hypothetical protein BGZ76_000173 [Entomortierella beljakovae]